MKRRMLAVMVLCLGAALLFWDCVLYEGENYRITQSALGGKMTVFNYEEVFALPAPDSILTGVSGGSLEEVINKVLSGNISWNEMYFIAEEPEMRFGGLLEICVPDLPEGCSLRKKGSANVFWNPSECKFWFSGEISGEISYCEENCRICKEYDARWERYVDQGSTDVKLCELDGARAMDASCLYLWGKDNGAGFHATLYCHFDDVTEEQLGQFGMKRYDPKHPELLRVRMLHYFGVIMIMAGAAVLLCSAAKPKRR